MHRKKHRASVTPTDVTRGFLERTPPSWRLEDLIQPLPSLSINTPLSGRIVLSEIEDNRYYQPERNPTLMPARSLKRRNSRVDLKPMPKGGAARRGLKSVHNLTFKSPEFVIRCIRRKIRDEVLHALGKTGKGSGKRLRDRVYHRNATSNARC